MKWQVDVSDTVVASAQRQEPEALETLVLALASPVYNVAMRFFGDPNDAEDETQNALLHVVRVVPKAYATMSEKAHTKGLTLSCSRRRLNSVARQRCSCVYRGLSESRTFSARF
ncbi:MAG: hypothetical protein AAFX94_03715 [Myxococcota bacterium]